MADVAPRKVTKESVRRFLVSMQDFLMKRRGKDGTLEAVKALECIQADPINVVHRNQHLVLHNRVTDYKPSYLEDLLYKDRRLFEYWCNEKSIIPIEDFPYFRYRMQNPSQYHSPFYERIKSKRKELKNEISYVLSEVKKQGPLSAREFEKKGKIKGKVATSVLHILWDCGDFMIHHVEGNRRYYDLTENVLPPNIDVETLSKEEYEQFMIHKYMRACRLIDTRDWRFGWLSLKASERKSIIKEMAREDRLHPIQVEDAKHTYYVLDEHLRFLDNSDKPLNDGICFVAPLDNLLWNRRMISEIFDFNYAWEVYKVPEKRIYGYYVMPILYGTRFIGRIDPKLDRQNKKMIINSLFLETKKTDENILHKLAIALQRFSKFHDASSFSIEKSHPRELKNKLMQKLSQ